MEKKQVERTSIFKSIFIIIVIGLIISYISPVLLRNLKFGLDLVGGFEVLYQVETVDGAPITSEIMTSTYRTIGQRIDVLGITEPEIIVEGRDRIRVRLAGGTDEEREQARRTLSVIANLTFRDSKDNLLMDSSVLRSRGASVGQDSRGNPAVALSIADIEKFHAVTRAISESEDKLIVIWLDFEEGVSSFEEEGNRCGTSGSNCLSSATVNQAFSSDVIIQGNFTLEEVRNLVDLINSGSMPTRLTQLSTRDVDASLGEQSLELTARAGLIGILLMIVLMIVIYRFAGFISSIGLVIYTFITIGIFWLFGGVLSLPGIAALVLGIGMATDSSILTFARIKQELKENQNLSGAIKKGNKNSFSAIFDANFTTLLVAIILFIFGESSVQGFATMLIISTIVTMVVMVYLTRWLVGLFVNTGLFDKKLNLFIGFRKKSRVPKFNFIKIRKFVYVYLGILIIIGAYSLFTNKLNPGLDFRGGSIVHVVSTETIEVDIIKADLSGLGFTVYDVDISEDQTNVVFKVEESFDEEQELATRNLLRENHDVVTEIGTVSNIVRLALIRNAIYATVFAIIGIIFYIAFRFKFTYAIGAIVSLFHDAFIIFVIFSFFGLEVTSIFIAAILSAIGYSLNDNIVSFDRIRETLRNKKDKETKTKEELEEHANEALNLTLGRAVVTGITTMCPVIMLIFFGADQILNFNIAMLIGLISGLFSSLFISGGIWYDIEKRKIGRPKKRKWYEEKKEQNS